MQQYKTPNNINCTCAFDHVCAHIQTTRTNFQSSIIIIEIASYFECKTRTRNFKMSDRETTPTTWWSLSTTTSRWTWRQDNSITHLNTEFISTLLCLYKTFPTMTHPLWMIAAVHCGQVPTSTPWHTHFEWLPQYTVLYWVMPTSAPWHTHFEWLPQYAVVLGNAHEYTMTHPLWMITTVHCVVLGNAHECTMTHPFWMIAEAHCVILGKCPRVHHDTHTLNDCHGTLCCIGQVPTSIPWHTHFEWLLRNTVLYYWASAHECTMTHPLWMIAEAHCVVLGRCPRVYHDTPTLNDCHGTLLYWTGIHELFMALQVHKQAARASQDLYGG